MKRLGHLFERVVALGNLELAAKAAQLGKRYRPDVLRFHFQEETELRRLREQLLGGSWRPGPHRHFVIHEPKKRWISAAPYRDRVVHHALCQVIEPVLERRMIFDSWANRRGKGTHRAVLRYQRFAGRFPWVLKIDLVQYFPSIDQEILKRQLRRVFKDSWLLALADLLIDHGRVPRPHRAYFPGDDLFTPFDRVQGLPIGNLTSQLWANSYLDSFDHWVKEELRAPAYLRFVDDMLVLGESKDRLVSDRGRIAHRLEDLRLRIHPTKSLVRRTTEGIPFLGYVIWPNKIRVRGETVRRFRRRLRRRAGLEGVPDPERSVAAWRGHVGLAGDWRRASVL